MVDPYTPPKAALETGPVLLRRAHLRTEVALQSLGSVFLAMGAGGVILGGAVGVDALVNGGAVSLLVRQGGVAVLFVAVGLGVVVLGRALRQLAPWTRWWAVAVAGLLALFFPIGTLVAVGLGWRLLSPRGRTVLSEAYGAVRAATPEIVPRSSLVVWLGVFVLVMGIVATSLPSCVH